ncbi:UNVERIFIED_CONTAM: hypothetical protein HDU68_007098 [Siphonaria sp. JEL0065]|nr:hypothetical protein HDU68_007098 [Siphonaria sp. JEL0065]
MHSDVGNKGLAHTPPEVLAEVIKYLPIDQTLVAVGLASKASLAPLIFNDMYLAHVHLNCQLQFTNLLTILDAMQPTNMLAIQTPFNYRTHLFGKLLSLTQRHNLSWSPHMTDAFVTRMIHALLTNQVIFDPSCQDALSIRLAADNGLVQAVKLLLSDSRVDPSTRDNYAIRCASEKGHLEVVQLLLQDPRVDPSARDNEAIRWASKEGHLEIGQLLLQDPRVDPSAGDNSAICWASKEGYLEIVQLLLPDLRVDPSAGDNYAIRWASREGHLEIVQLLLQDPRVNPSADDSGALRYASEKGHLEIVQLLLQDPRVDPSAEDNEAIWWASDGEHLEIFQLLLHDPRVDPSAKDNYAIRWASKEGHLEIVQLLLQDPRVDPSARDNEAIRWASKKGHLEIVDSVSLNQEEAKSNYAQSQYQLSNIGHTCQSSNTSAQSTTWSQAISQPSSELSEDATAALAELTDPQFTHNKSKQSQSPNLPLSVEFFRKFYDIESKYNLVPLYVVSLVKCPYSELREILRRLKFPVAEIYNYSSVSKAVTELMVNTAQAGFIAQKLVRHNFKVFETFVMDRNSVTVQQLAWNYHRVNRIANTTYNNQVARYFTKWADYLYSGHEKSAEAKLLMDTEPQPRQSPQQPQHTQQSQNQQQSTPISGHMNTEKVQTGSR